MEKRFRPLALLWVLFLALAGRALILRLRYPGQRTSPWILGGLLGFLALRMLSLTRDWRRGRLPGTRLLLPALVCLEGLGLMIARGPGLTFKLRLATALVLEALLLVLAIRAWRSVRSQPGAWPEDRIALAFEAFLPPRAARLIALELVMLGSALRFLCGGFRDPAPPGFSHHREAALGGFLPALPLLIPGDILLLHALFPHLAPWLRWILHGSTIYAVLWLFGFYATLKARPHQICDGQLHLHQGLVKSVSFPVGLIQSIGPLPEFNDDWARHAHMKGVQKLVAAGPAVLELELSEPVRVLGLLGPGRPTTRLAFSVDDPAAFRAALEQV
ncbi:hypothetical protein [Geothrix sp. PMB-07]|uniref:hypothetical protein n=1 Tax=Geothrix sp. PMB-07 TaxID=3068640 RepID=UPI002740417F|nr:hypothetical protein [Geothrix sp. PMB-07]WLT32634.1 hypothetical protein Q9293_04710 [Geothrix sp. PMB-07]